MGGAYGGGYGNGYSPYNNDPYNQPPTLSHQIQNSTAPAFAVMESLVGAFTSLAQLFESTYIATHSSFFAMVGVADQLGGLKTYLAQVLGVFSVLRLGKRIVAWIKGDRSAFSSSSTNPGNWAEEWNWKIGRAAGGPKDQGLSPPNGPTGSKRPSSKPLILFLLSSIGLPWLMSKLIKLLTRLQEEKQRAALGLAPGTMLDATGRPVNVNSNPNAAGGKAQGQPGTITFARALFPFEPTAGHELALKRDEIVAVMQRFEEGASSGGKELGWWRGRTRDGRTGWFPGNYVSRASGAGGRERKHRENPNHSERKLIRSVHSGSVSPTWLGGDSETERDYDQDRPECGSRSDVVGTSERRIDCTSGPLTSATMANQDSKLYFYITAYPYPFHIPDTCALTLKEETAAVHATTILPHI